MAKKVKQMYTCPHCSKEFDFPVAWCKCCNMHNHTAFMGGSKEYCSCCREGRTPHGEKMFGKRDK